MSFFSLLYKISMKEVKGLKFMFVMFFSSLFFNPL